MFWRDKEHLDTRRRIHYQRAALSEDEEFAASEKELRESPNRFVGAAPLIVLTQAPANSDAIGYVWVGLNARLTGWSLRGTQIVVPDVGHAIELERPDLVIDALEKAIALIKQ